MNTACLWLIRFTGACICAADIAVFVAMCRKQDSTASEIIPLGVVSVCILAFGLNAAVTGSKFDVTQRGR